MCFGVCRLLVARVCVFHIIIVDVFCMVYVRLGLFMYVCVMCCMLARVCPFSCFVGALNLAWWHVFAHRLLSLLDLFCAISATRKTLRGRLSSVCVYVWMAGTTGFAASAGGNPGGLAVAPSLF